MRERRAGYVAGAGWALLSIVAGAFVPKPPALDASTATVTAFVTSHRHGLVVGSTVSAVAALLMLPFVVSLTSHIADEWAAQVARTAAAVMVAAGVLGGALQSVFAVSYPSLDAGSASASYRLVMAVFYTAPPLAACLMLAAISFGLRGSDVPAWIGVSAGVISVLALVGAVVGLTGGGSQVMLFGLAGFLLMVVWTLATSLVMLRRSVGTAATSASRSYATG